MFPALIEKLQRREDLTVEESSAAMSLRGVLDVVRRVRADIDTPIVLFTYANPVVRMNPQVFVREAADAGVDGVLILDYPIEEAEPLRAPLLDAGLDPIFLISPTTTEERIRRSAALGAGFLYVISRLGVTGMTARGVLPRSSKPCPRCNAQCSCRTSEHRLLPTYVS